ncbi:hypothetical protein TEQG_04774 [Trichophyton equinum CBS 127.97]|uniref:Uncharacterized protein n=1 Tax=Trichophyton equinum (strain ATCC MYA-4606 / CBS 127.97) TaxID=559882 RepID=F2PV48_TRIEC|nr:hypothetical protein TEQG_04774 [Trichophyton equinum CBS 127.97]
MEEVLEDHWWGRGEEELAGVVDPLHRLWRWKKPGVARLASRPGHSFSFQPSGSQRSDIITQPANVTPHHLLPPQPTESTFGLPQNVTSGNTGRKAIEDRNERRRKGPAGAVTGPASYNTEQKEARPYIRRIMWRGQVPVAPIQIVRHAKYRWLRTPAALGFFPLSRERDDDAPPAG